jgi:hypothetical protein
MSNILERYLNWMEQQKTVKMFGGEIMYDVKGSHVFLKTTELFDYWKANVE